MNPFADMTWADLAAVILAIALGTFLASVVWWRGGGDGD